MSSNQWQNVKAYHKCSFFWFCEHILKVMIGWNTIWDKKARNKKKQLQLKILNDLHREVKVMIERKAINLAWPSAVWVVMIRCMISKNLK